MVFQTDSTFRYRYRYRYRYYFAIDTQGTTKHCGRGNKEYNALVPYWRACFVLCVEEKRISNVESSESVGRDDQVKVHYTYLYLPVLILDGSQDKTKYLSLVSSLSSLSGICLECLECLCQSPMPNARSFCLSYSHSHSHPHSPCHLNRKQSIDINNNGQRPSNKCRRRCECKYQ